MPEGFFANHTPLNKPWKTTDMMLWFVKNKGPNTPVVGSNKSTDKGLA